MFKIVTCGWNVGRYIGRCIESVLAQTLSDWELRIVVDPCTDDSLARALSYADPRIHASMNDTRQFAMKNIVDAIASSAPGDDEIIALLDADDFLCDINALSIVKRTYERHDCLLTYGNMKWLSDGHADRSTPYRPWESFRKYKWKVRHLRTMKYKLWRRIPVYEFKDETGEWLRVTWDMAIMIPAMELAGRSRIRRIPDVIYAYDDTNPANDFRTVESEQKRIENLIRSRPRLKRAKIR